MPEGPEIHREADAIRSAIGGDESVYVYFYHNHLKEFEKELTGRKITSVQARGKGMIISFGDNSNIYSHNQLYGKWMIRDAGNYPNTNRQLRLEIQTAQKSAQLYSASEIDVLDAASLEEHPYLKSLGPDILGEISVVEIVERAKSDEFKRRSFATLLLDQHFLGGVGNYLRTEFLFFAGIHPDKRPVDLSDEELKSFGETVLTITHRTYQTGGITLDEERVDKLKKLGKKRKTYRFYAFNREGETCHFCGNPIKKIQKSGRRLYLCPQCQSK
jgi:endonuclease-8